MKKMKKFVSLSLSLVMTLTAQFGALSSKETVSARADRHYYFGVYDTNVSEYLNLREKPNVNSKSIGQIPAGAQMFVEKVSGHMGAVSGYNYNGKYYNLLEYKNGEYVCKGWINLDYADEFYYGDEDIFGEVEDFVPTYYDSITWRSQPNTYSSALGYFMVGFATTRDELIVNGKMAYYKGGYYNLDYMATRR
ncbi:MAG: SH3 domain-containing protein [Ruminococcus sp.]|nr:SH3 domain-containing protein [Ruminococcus sp.]